MSNHSDLFAALGDQDYDDSIFDTTAGNPLSAYSEVLDELAQKAFDGGYGTTPFEAGTEGNRALLHDAYEKVGAHLPEEYWLSFDGADGGIVLKSIQWRCDYLVEKDVADNGLDFSAASFAMEQEDADANAHPAELQSRDSTVLEADNPQILVDAIVASNEGRLERGEDLIQLQPETIAELEKRGVDVSGLVGTESMSNQETERNNGAGHDVAAGQQPPSAQNDVASPVETENQGETGVDRESRQADLMQFANDSHGDNVLITIERDSDDAPKDIILIDQNGDELRLSDITASLAGGDERIEEIFGRTLEMADRGEDWKEYLQTSLTEYAETLREPRDISVEEDQNNNQVDGDDQNQKYQDRFEYHQQAYANRIEAGGGFTKDTFAAYHEMAKIYNAYKGGIEIDGRVPDAADVYLAYSKFANSNIFETLLIDAIRTAVEKPERNDVEQVNPSDNVEKPSTDIFGIQESGRIDAPVDEQTAKNISAYRKDLPEAAMSYGADMTKVDRGSRDDITIRTTNAQNAGGRGVSITLDSAKRFTMPDLRLVDFKGERMLVDPFGKVLDVVSGDGKFKVGQTLTGLDVSSSENGKVALETYARDNGISVEQAKTEISATCQERFCDRIQDSYRVEARAIEQTVIPREQETKADIEAKIANLGRMEQMATTPEDKASIEQKRADLQEAKTTIEGRITALKDRVDQLHTLADRGVARSLSDRFADAVASEKGAIGRSVTTVDFGVDMKAISNDVRGGVEEIKARVEAYNADKPEMDRISYDAKTGDFVDRFGINDKGEYVGNKNGNFMADGVTGPETREQVEEYIKDHFDPSRFEDLDKILTTDLEQQERNDLDREQNNSDPVEADAHENNTELGQEVEDQADNAGSEGNTEQEQQQGDPTESSNTEGNTEQEQNAGDPIESSSAEGNTEQEQNDPDHVENTGLEENTEQEQNDPLVENSGAENGIEEDTNKVELTTGSGADSNVENDQNGIGGNDVEVFEDDNATSKATTGNVANDESENNELDPVAIEEDDEASNAKATTSEENEGELTATENSDTQSPASGVESEGEEVGGTTATETFAEGINTLEEGVRAIDGIDDGVAAKTITAGPELTAAEGDHDKTVTGPDDAPVQATEVSDWAKGFSDGLSELDISDGKDAIADFISAHSDSLAGILNGIDDDKEKASAISDIAHFVLDAFNDWLGDANPALVGQCVEIGANFMEGMLGSLGMETAIDLANAIYDAQNDMAYEAHSDQIDQMTDGLQNGLEPYMAEYYELDDFIVTQNGTTDGYTGEEVGGFPSQEAAEKFVSDVAADVENTLTNTDFVDQQQGNQVDNEVPNQVENNGVDNEFDDQLQDTEVFENQEITPFENNIDADDGAEAVDVAF